MNHLSTSDSTQKNIHCPHFDVCSGCTLNENVDKPPILQEANEFFYSKGVNFSLQATQPIHWRLRAKLAVRGTSLLPLIGLYQEGTHEVVNIPLCRVHHPAINQAIEVLKQWITNESIVPYNESSNQGLLRYVQLVVERTTKKVQLALVINVSASHLTKTLQQAFQRLWASQINGWHSLWVNFNERRDNVIFGKEWLLLNGEPLLWEKLGGVQTCFHPSSFGQANLEQFEALLSSIRLIVPPQKRVFEYYAGSGIIGLNLAAQSASVHCCEVNPGAEIGFKAAREKLEPVLATKVSFEVGAVLKKLNLLEEADVVIVDPPRKGLEVQLVKALNQTINPKLLIYVSCGWSSFRRDCELLLQGGWQIQQAEGFLFFPGSNHIETLTVFQK